MQRRAQNGFTIVELVVVIILLGILAATALPRFMDVDDEAHAAVVQGVLGSLQTGVSMYHAQWMAEGQPDPDAQITAFNLLRTNATGFPYGTVDNSGGTSDVTTSADCVAVFNNIMQAGAPSIGPAADIASVVGSTTDFTAVEAAPDCQFIYTGATSVSAAAVPVLDYDSATGAVVRRVPDLTLP